MAHGPVSTLFLHAQLNAARPRATAPLFAVTPQNLMRLVVDAQERRDLQETGGWSILERDLRTDFSRGLDGTNAQDLADRHAWFQTRTGDASLPEDNKRTKTPTEDEQLARRSRCQLVMSVLFHDEPTLVMWVLFLGAALPAIVNSVVYKADNDVGESVCFLLMAVAMTCVRVATEWQNQSQLRDQYGYEANGTEDTASDTGSITIAVTVVRCGEPTPVPVDELRVGDVLLLNVGDVLVADGVLVPGSSVSVDESASGVVFKDHSVGEIVVAGSKVVEAHGVGGAKLLVLCVGERTLQHQLRLGTYGDKELSAWVLSNYKRPTTSEGSEVNTVDAAGEYAALASPKQGLIGTEDDQTKPKDEKAEWKEIKRQWKADAKEKKRARERAKAKSPFHLQVTNLQSKLRTVGGFAAAGLLVVLVAIQIHAAHSGGDAFATFRSVFVAALTMVAVTSPEGSDLVASVATSAAIKRLKASNVFVRDMYAAETPGSMTVLCVDKTGTLTTNNIRVAHMWTANASGPVPVSTTPSSSTVISEQLARWMVLLAAQSGQAMPSSRQDEPQDEGRHGKDPYDAALLHLLSDHGVHYERFLHDVKGWSTVQVWPFSSERQRKTVILTQYHAAAATSTKQVRVVTSGAPEMVLQRCSSIMASDGVVSVLDAKQRQTILSNVARQHTLAGHRVVCIACRVLDADGDEDGGAASPTSRLETDLVCLAIVAFEDPVRPTAPLAIEMLHNVGVAVCMVTGDDATTATEIARKCGILRGDDFADVEKGCTVMDAGEFRALITDRNGDIKRVEFERVWPSLRVLTRASALDKYLLVKGLQLAGESVGMVGDSDNVAFALQASDVGFALGTSGTSICRHSSNVVLLDDNLTSIATAVAWGRVVRAQMAAHLQLQVVVVSVALTVIAFGAIVKHLVPFATVQVLWFNFVMIVFVLMSRFLANRSSFELHSRAPRPIEKQLFDAQTRISIISHSLHQMVVLSLLVYFDDSLFGSNTTVSAPPNAPGSTRLLAGVSSHVAERIDQTENIAELSVPMTVVFNTFVWMQLFCQTASHAKTDPANQCRHFYKAWVAMGAVQVVVVQCVASWFNCEPLTGIQWLVCMAVATTTLLVDWVARRIT